MRKTTKRVLSLLLALFMMLGTCDQALALELGSSGEESTETKEQQ